MIHPSYSELMNVINSGVEEGEQPLVPVSYTHLTLPTKA